MKKLVNIALLAALVALSVNGVFAVPVVKAETPSSSPTAYVPGEILIKIKSGSSVGQLSLAKYGIASIERLINETFISGNDKREIQSLGLDRIYWVKFSDPQVSIQDVIQGFKLEPYIEYAEPNYTYKLQATPNDPKFSQQMGLENNGGFGGTPGADINATQAWSNSNYGFGKVFNVAIIDSGINYNHEDLLGNIWTDTDGSHGRDFVNSDNDPMDDNGHGTFLAGVIGAKSNNGIGVAGVNADAKMAAIKAFNSAGFSNEALLVMSVAYAAQKGFKLVNASWVSSSYGSFGTPLYEIMKANSDILFVTAAGNGFCNPLLPLTTHNISCQNNNDINHYYPASYDLPNIIAVGGSNIDDKPKWNYGPISVDLAAPESTFSTGLDSSLPYRGMGGTSVSAAFVTGAASIYWGASTNLSKSNLDVKNAILTTVDKMPSMINSNLTSGRLDLNNLFENNVASVVAHF